MPSIAICGAGPAGLTLGRILQQANIDSLDITFFEKDASPTSRTYQGGTLDLHSATGQAALKAAGLFDEFQKHARYEGEELKFGDKNATIYMHMTEQPQIGGFDARPEIDREILKDILLKSVKPEIVQWNKGLKLVDVNSGMLTFADGAVAGPFDLVVGADGAWSKVRAALTKVKPSYSGICGIEGSIDEASAGSAWKAISKMVGKGSYFNSTDGKSLMAQRMGDGTLKMSSWVQREPTWPEDVVKAAAGDDSKIKQTLLADFSDWDPSLTAWIRHAHRFRPWPLYELPVGHTWEHKKGFTLIGDSAHLMTPFAGEGVNAALKDALELAEAIIECLTDSETTSSLLDDAVKTYEERMFPRACKVQQETAGNKKFMFDANAPVSLMAHFISTVAEETGHDLNKGWIAWLPVRKTVNAYFRTVRTIGRVRRRLREFFGFRRNI